MPLLNWSVMTDWRFEDEWEPTKSYLLTLPEIQNWSLKHGMVAEHSGFFWVLKYTELNTGSYTVHFEKLD